ncbi:MAG: transcription-repair coupling factor [Bacteroidales bacterium]|nr:transcription-repair coupling factor [Bacteroidales bacterium]MCF8327060.1 transcription-repair coupling factor [Bacteroidales bacterium]
MRTENILQQYRNDERIEALVNNLQVTEEARYRFSGLAGSSLSFLSVATYQNLPWIHLFVLPDQEAAAYFLNDMENLLDDKENPYHKKQVLFFPVSYKRPYEPEITDNTNLLSRTEVLKRISSRGKKTLIVTYPEALTEKVVKRSYIKKNTFRLQTGEQVSLDFMNDLLHEYGFAQTDFVLEPGEFSVRGGIIDVFSFTNDKPYRIEFFGDEIESIRSFNPEDQLSLETLNHITIVPNVQGRDNNAGRQAFLEFLPRNSVIWIENPVMTCDLIREERKKVDDAFAGIKQDDEQSEVQAPETLFTDADEFWQQLQPFHIIELGKQNHFRDADVIQFNHTPQPSFNKTFDLLLESLEKNAADGYSNYILTDNPRQIERIQTILEDVYAQRGEEAPGNFNPLMISIHEGFVDHDKKIACYTDHQIFDRYHKFRLKSGYKNKESITLKELYNLEPGDYVTHIDHGVGKFDGLQKINNNGKEQEAVRLIYKNNDLLYVSIHSLHRIAKYIGKEGKVPKVDKLGSNAWKNLKNRTKKKVKDIASDLIKLYAKRKATTGHTFPPDNYLQHELEASFIYEDTPDQLAATQAVKKDMEASFPMDRLVCGDVGFGKTEVAIRAAFKAVADSKQVVVLVPTTILAMQHYRSFQDRLKDFPVTIDYLNRFKTAKQQRDILHKLKEGELDIVIGTHRVVSKDVTLDNLGLLVIDEEQKFGVSVKEKLRQMRANVDTLTLTATPIPRTLQFSLMGARDLSIINTPPPNRHPVQTELHSFNEDLIKESIEYEINRGGQVFFLHNRVQNINEVAHLVEKVVPRAKIGVGHGKMDGKTLEKIMLDFIEGKFDVLVATTIIESGLDIPNANTMIINEAHHYGLSDLHQLRGRVGRSNKKAFCYLLAPPVSTLTADARKRLKALEDFSALGSGFNIAMRDLDIRGAGNILGAEQSGFISEMGYEMYQKIINDAMQELKSGEFKELFQNEEQTVQETQETARDCSIESDLHLLIPDTYVSSPEQRLSLYKRLDELNTEKELDDFRREVNDRFGPVPAPVEELIRTKYLRTIAAKVGFEKIILKNGQLAGHFISDQESPYFQSAQFMNVIKYAQNNPKRVRLKEKKDKLTILMDKVNSIDDAIKVLQPILNQ